MYFSRKTWLTLPFIFTGAIAFPPVQDQVAKSVASESSQVPEASIPITRSAASPASTTTPIAQDACSKILPVIAGRNLSLGTTAPATLAWDCLQSVPLDLDSALAWLESVRPYLQWQSTLTYLANPPEGYFQSAIDINVGLDNIIAGARSGDYTNEYSLELDLYLLIQQKFDGHFRYLPNLIGNVLTFGRPFTLVSVTSNGDDGIPKQHVYDDILLASTISSFEPSAITHINGLDVVTYLADWSRTGLSQDPDALWNALFYSPAAGTLASIGYTAGPGLFAGSGGSQYNYPGPNTTLEFENGTSITRDNFARVLQSFQNVTGGSDVFTRYVAPTATSVYTYTALPTVTRLPCYPVPIVIQGNGLDSGYYLEAAGYEDVAVLSIPTFEDIPFVYASGLGFRDAAFNFIDQAKADGKTKLIIDVSANGGGTILQGYTFFLKLFPDIFPYLGQRIRATESVDIIGQTLAAALDAPGYSPSNVTEERMLEYLVGTPIDYQSDLDVNNQSFPSWPAKFGPHTYHNDNFSSIFRYNTTSTTFNVNYTDIRPTRPFETKNIILLTDGNCACTCSIFAELLTRQAGVKTVVVGGRPNKNPMQALGATKGAENIGWIDVFYYVNSTCALYPADQQAAFNATPLSAYNELPFYRGDTGSLNFKDQLIQGDETQTPLQLVYEAADCRIAMTISMVVDVTALWKKVYDVTWNGKDCLVGSLNDGIQRE